jgi:hypothetical protein
MKYLKIRFNYILAISLLLIAARSKGQTKQPVYFIYAGSTHAHTFLTQSHGAQWEEIKGFKNYMSVDSNHVSHAANTRMKPDSDKYQGSPATHFAIAKANKYDFYITTDHSQEASFHPTSATNPNWIATHKAAQGGNRQKFCCHCWL